MKKTYMCPSSVQLNMETEQMIAGSGLRIDSTQQADQWSNHRSGWDSESWAGLNDYQD